MKIIYTIVIFTLTSLILTNIDSYIREGRFVQIRNMKAKWNHLNKLEGISGDNYLNINKYGLKGSNFGNEKLRVLVIGNSLVEGALLDSSELWSARIEEKLRMQGLDVRVFNAGKSGSISAQRFIDIYDAYMKYNFDMVILYPMARYNEDYKSTEGFSEFFVPDFKNRELSLRNNSIVQILRNRKWELASYLKNRFGLTLFRNAVVDPEHVRGMYTKIAYRAKLSIANLDEEYFLNYKKDYRRGVHLVSKFFEDEQVPVLMLERMHGALYVENENEMTMWWGDIDWRNEKDPRRISLKDYQKILAVERSELEEFRSELIDILALEDLNSDKSWFYDHHHFNEKGAMKMGSIIANRIFPKLQKIQLSKENKQ